MKHRLRLLSVFAAVAVAAAQQAPTARDLDDMLRQARLEISNFLKAGGKNGDPGHPAEKWAQELWKSREASPGTPDAAKAAIEAVRFLVYADRFAEAQARVERIPSDDPAWQGLSRLLLASAARQKNYTYFFAKSQSLLTEATDVKTKAAVHVSLGRAFRSQRERQKAEAAFRAAIDLAGESPAGKEAATLLYELLHLAIGLPAPAFSATTTTGARLSLADYRGKPVVLVFWFTGCAECVSEVPLLKQLHAKYRDRGLELVGVSLDDEPGKVDRFIAEKGVVWPQLCDGKTDEGAIPKLYSVNGTPDLYVIDRAGNIAARLENAKQLDRHLAEVAASDAFPPRTERDSWERPVEIMEQLRIRAGSTVAEVGPGDGYFTSRLAARVGPGGAVRGAPDAALKESTVDAILAVDVFHQLTRADSTLAGIYRALGPSGRLAVLENRIPPEKVIAQAAASGLRLVSFDADFSGPRENRLYLASFEKPRLCPSRDGSISSRRRTAGSGWPSE